MHSNHYSRDRLHCVYTSVAVNGSDGNVSKTSAKSISANPRLDTRTVVYFYHPGRINT
ncbi:MAG: hypothetical protein HC815_36045 [Richelia sp. RM1_1_1]|nr:hypothetical protein [Richelia sp. RM1_1_1]